MTKLELWKKTKQLDKYALYCDMCNKETKEYISILINKQIYDSGMTPKDYVYDIDDEYLYLCKKCWLGE